MNVRIFPVARPESSQVVATIEYIPELLSDVLGLVEFQGHPGYRAAWIVDNRDAESELWVFRSIEDRAILTRLTHIARSGLKWRQGFETTRVA